jgi:ATP-dependent helicase/nuclease subunit A
MLLLPKDTELQFPHQMMIPASAGSGKTYTLAHRYVQFLLSPKIHANGLRNILAITFTKLAAKEMKERIVMILKEAALGKTSTLSELSRLVSLSQDDIAVRSEQLVNQILHNYSDFNVRTIDSFLTTIYKASAFELGVQPDIGIEFDPDAILDQAFRQYSQNLREGTADSQFIDDLISLIQHNDSPSKTFLWNPFSKIASEVRQLHKQFGKFIDPPIVNDGSRQLTALKQTIISKASSLRKLLEKTTLPVNHHYKNEIEKLANGDVFEVVTRAKKTKYFNKYSEDAGAAKEIKKLFSVIKPLETELEQYISLYAHTYYQPFVKTVGLLEKTLQEVKLLKGSVVLDDINRSLANYLSTGSVPEVYIKLGERIAHFMIDEFQDTSPIQWKNLQALIEEAVSKGGTLFAVGDTKQSIYSFRGGDWKIFKALIEKKYFPSAPAEIIPLETNYRSAQALVEFVKDVFSVHVANAGLDREAAASGLYKFAQDVPEHEKNKGYVEVRHIEKTDDETSANAQRTYFLSTIEDCLSRHYSYGDIAILTQTNAEVVELSSWLNQARIPFLSLSTLDIRKRKVIAEVIALLRFLDSPIDNLSFATFVLGEAFQSVLGTKTHSEKFHTLFSAHRKEYFYRTFQKHFPELWERYFDRAFSLVGYMPLYDIVSEVYKTFALFEHCPAEESALIKLLECVKQFENSGSNSLKDFLSYSGEEGSDPWSIDVPSTVHAVRIMTVHKAKGLGFPVVIVSLKERRPYPNAMLTVETENGLSVIRIGKQYGERNEYLGRLYSEREVEQKVDELNKIYVALTRARKEMYVSILFKKQENLPVSILPEKIYGSKYVTAEKEKQEEKLSSIESLYRTERIALPVARNEKIGLQETRRGETIHQILSHIEFLSEDIERDIREAVQKTTPAFNIEIDKEIATLVQCLSLPNVNVFFTSQQGRIVLREQDIAAADGRLYRMDRVILDPAAVIIVDFKTGSDEKSDEYQEQVRNYMEMSKAIYPEKKVTGALLYVDLRKVVEVR